MSDIHTEEKNKVVGGTLYLAGKEVSSGKLLQDATCCAMCRRMIINSGLEKVVIRQSETEFEVVPVQQWIEEDDMPQLEENGGCTCH